MEENKDLKQPCLNVKKKAEMTNKSNVNLSIGFEKKNNCRNKVGSLHLLCNDNIEKNKEMTKNNKHKKNKKRQSQLNDKNIALSGELGDIFGENLAFALERHNTKNNNNQSMNSVIELNPEIQLNLNYNQNISNCYEINHVSNQINPAKNDRIQTYNNQPNTIINEQTSH